MFAFLIIVLIALILIAYPRLQRLWIEQRRARIKRQPFPEAWEHILQTHVPLYKQLPPSLGRQLQGHVHVLLAEKDFHGANGLTITDSMRLIIASQAALLLLNRHTDYFSDLRSIVLYPAEFVVRRDTWDAAGVHHAEHQVLSGESWSQGQMVLSWDDSLSGGMNSDDGYNVVLHEFAHQLDHASGATDGVPVDLSRRQLETWAQAFMPAYEDHCRRVAAGEDTWLDPYAAEDPAEFFAVLTEYFFERPADVKAGYPEVYRALQGYYRVDPSGWKAATRPA